MTTTTRVIAKARKAGVTVRTRRDWGTRREALYQWRRIHKRARQPADTVVLHITVTHGPGPGGKTLSDCMRELERIGYDRFGSGISYNFAIAMTGEGNVGVGQSLDAKGTHTVNRKHLGGFSYDQNLVARAIAFVGMPGDRLSPDAQEATIRLLVAMVQAGAVTEGFDLMPHSAFAAKDCPTDTVRQHMPEIRAEVARRLIEGRKNR